MNISSVWKRIVDTDVFSTTQVLLHVWSYDFYDIT